MRRTAITLVFFTGLFILLLVGTSVRAQSTFDAPADSIRIDTLAYGLDTFTLTPESLHQPEPSRVWILPLSIIAATGAAILLLFSTRSR
jgi:hypothetical protein